MKTLVKVLAEEGKTVVMDVPRHLDPLAMGALTEADTVGVVTELTLAGARDTHRLLELLAALRPGGAVLVIGNRLGGAPGEIPRPDFETAIGRKLDFGVPFDAGAAVAAAERGKAFVAAAQGAAAAELRRLADHVAGGADVVAPARPAGLLKRLLGR